MNTLFVVSVYLLLNAGSSVTASNNSPQHDVETVVQKLITRGESLASGEAIINGTERRHGVTAEEKFDNHWNIKHKIIFDEIQKWVRIEREISSMRPKDATRPPASNEILIYGPDSAIHVSVEAKQIFLSDKTKYPQTWDLRTFGICTFDDVIHFNRLHDFSVSFKRALKQGHFRVANGQTKDELILDYYFNLNPEKPEFIHGRRRLWLDASREFVPVKMEEQFLTTEVQDIEAAAHKKALWKSNRSRVVNWSFQNVGKLRSFAI